MDVHESDFLVIGSGVAGLYTAIRAAAHASVTLVTKGGLLDSNTWYAQGGIAAALGREDSPDEHLRDTLLAGAGLCVEDAVAVLVADGPQRVCDLINLGAQFDRDASGELLLGREAAHSRRRIVHARGDATGAEVAESLAQYAAKTPGLHILEGCLAIDLLMSGRNCTGALLLAPDGRLVQCHARGTVLATGGCGQLYRYTTNPQVATGDGLAIAARAGANLLDMEFVQFHPTALAIDENPMPLVSEAVRGEGAHLVTEQGERFMTAVHPWAELAPRDVVARAIFDMMQKGHQVYLDTSSIGQRFSSRFPNIYRLCIERGTDPSNGRIPVAPAAHFVMGGVETDTEGATSIPRLYACGEVACTGVHGANRLASNSLLEGMVFAERVSQSLRKLPVLHASDKTSSAPLCRPSLPPEDNQKQAAQAIVDQVQKLMWDHAGIVRTGEGLAQALESIQSLRTLPAAATYPAANMLHVAESIVSAAAIRTESRGGHYRRDFPTEDPVWADRRIALTTTGIHTIQAVRQESPQAPASHI